MPNSRTLIGSVLVLCLGWLLAGCPLPECEPDAWTEYTYETFDPDLSGDCDILIEAMGCSSGDCMIVGTAGEMRLGLCEEEGTAAAQIRGDDSSEWIELHGSLEGDGFSVTYQESENAEGCIMDVELTLEGDATSGSISGQMLSNMNMHGDCYGLSFDCDLDADFEAEPAAGG